MAQQPAPPADAHEWVSFEDPDEHRTWVFDVTFMASAWTCIFGQGCQGVLTGPAPELVQGCCSYGAHFTDDEDIARVEQAASRLSPDEWQYARQGRTRGIWKTEKSGERVTRMVDGACVFLNRPGWPTGPGCSLHQAALRRDERPLDAKPNVCWQLPLRREDAEDGEGHVTSTIRQWDRRHWGDGGSEFHWWCTESPEAFVGRTAVYVEMRDELIELTSPAAYEMLAAYLVNRTNRANRANTASGDDNGTTAFLPHPAVRAKPAVRAMRP
ncbi:MAG TPA: hypothetical protein VGO92_14720 [Acidimicrobiales bacterium]|jgi:hypothetical protein|nr:hypothetical protein [Acidimicrobiales bacterium]